MAAEMAAATDGKARHIRDKGFNNQCYCCDLIVKIIREHQPVSRKDIDEMLLDKLPEVLSREQKLMKIHNLIYDLSHRQKLTRNSGNRRFSKWVLLNKPSIKQ